MSENVEFISNHTKIGRIQRELYENRSNIVEKHEENVENVTKKMINRHGHPMELTVITTKELKEALVQPTDNIKFIRAQNTREMFKMDTEDWKRAKDIPWFETEAGVLTTSRGQTFEDYVGIIGARKHPFNLRDKRREHYHNC